MLAFVVDDMFIGSFLACPLIAAVDFGKCHWTGVAVCPDDPAMW